MNINRLRKFSGRDLEQIVRYVSGDLNKFTTDLFAGLSKLTLKENFESDRHDLLIAAGGTATVPNRRGTKDMDVLLMNQSGAAYVAQVTDVFVSITNPSADPITVTAFLLRR